MVPRIATGLVAVLIASKELLLAAARAADGFVLYNATVLPVANASKRATALCVSDGKVVEVGNDTWVLNSTCGNASRRLGRAKDLHGAMVIPGLTDSHAHLLQDATRRTRADLSGSTSAAAAVQDALNFSVHHKDLVKASGGWVLGFGWDQTTWKGGAFPTRYDIDKIFPDHPVFLEQLSGHACWVNSKAIEMAAKDIPAKGDPPGGHIERDADGKPTGIFSDDAMNAITKHIPPLSDAMAQKALNEVFEDCARNGLTGIHDMYSRPHDIDVLLKLQQRGALPLRVYGYRSGDMGDPKMPMVSTSDEMLTVRGVKFFADGAMGSWSAAMLEPYSDKPDTKGTLVYSTKYLRANISQWVASGYQVAVHAIGDAANRQVLNIYEDLMRSGAGGKDPRWRVEHAQILSPEDAPRFAKLGIIPSMQPSHCAADLGYADKRLGKKRAAGGYIWKSLLESGVKVLPFGSDFPTAGSIPPLLGLHAAVTRETPAGVPSGGWHPEQRVSMSQAIHGYTMDAAAASFREDRLGAIQPGFYADLTIVDRDLLATKPEDLLETVVLGTVVGGHFSYVAEDAKLQATGAVGLKELVVTRRPARPTSSAASSVVPAGVGEVVESWWSTYVQDWNEDNVPDFLV